MSALSDDQIQGLIAAARTVQEHAYAPYSHFPVGAALLDVDGDTHLGCNVENASFGLTTCAERTAFCKAVASGQKKFAAIAIVTNTDHRCPPCGLCRQVMAEFCESDFIIIMAWESGHRILDLEAVLPERFDKSLL